MFLWNFRSGRRFNRQVYNLGFDAFFESEDSGFASFTNAQ